MKKFTLFAAAILVASSISLSSCSKNPADKVVDILHEYTERVNDATSIEELKQILADAQEEEAKFEKEFADFTPSEEQEDAIVKAQDELRAAYMKASEKFGY